jgi:hypothetical protein
LILGGTLSDEVVPYAKRRLAVIGAPEPKESRDSSGSSLGKLIAEGAQLAGVPVGLLGLVAGLAIDLYTSSSSSRPKDAPNLYAMPGAEIERYTWPVGHPRPGVVYAASPVRYDTYFTVAEFQDALLLGKVAEAMDLVASLGARKVKIRQVAGQARDLGGSIGLSIPGAGNVKAKADNHRKHDSQIEYSATFTPVLEPHIPDDLLWFPHEPMWQSMAKLRLRNGLDTCDLAIRFTSDYGVSGELAAKIQEVGLSIGGKFAEDTSTEWTISAEF